MNIKPKFFSVFNLLKHLKNSPESFCLGWKKNFQMMQNNVPNHKRKSKILFYNKNNEHREHNVYLVKVKLRGKFFCRTYVGIYVHRGQSLQSSGKPRWAKKSAPFSVFTGNNVRIKLAPVLFFSIRWYNFRHVSLKESKHFLCDTWKMATFHWLMLAN
jgi:hypothetical protein